MVESSRSKKMPGGVAIFGMAIPLVILVLLFIFSKLLHIDIGTLIFALTGITALAWLTSTGWGRRIDAARPTGELLRRSATDYGREISQGTYVQLPLPTRILFVLMGTTVLGWIGLVATM